MNRHLLSQIIKDPRRINNILDLILLNKEDEVMKYECRINEILSDHNTIIVKLKSYPGAKKYKCHNKEYYDTAYTSTT